MSRLHRILAVGVAVCAFALVAVAERPGTGAMAQQTVAPFTEIEFTLPGELTLLRGESPRVGITAEPQQLEAIEVIVDDGLLIIRADERGWLRRVALDDVKVEVSYQALNALRIAGSGDALGDAFASDAFELSVSGSGSALLQSLSCKTASFGVAGSGDIGIQALDATSSTTEISGSGDIVLRGTVAEQVLRIAGSGDYRAGGLISQSALLNIAGSGSARLQASERISGSILGSGDLLYVGEPELAIRVEGSGEVKQLPQTL
ncbi:MAG: head GIN domain-containing protein [Pseudomonadales bacterium]